MHFTLNNSSFSPKFAEWSPAATGCQELPLTPTVQGILQSVSQEMSSWYIATLTEDFPQNDKENIILAKIFIREPQHSFHLKFKFTASFCCRCLQTEKVNKSQMDAAVSLSISSDVYNKEESTSKNASPSRKLPILL